MNLRPINLTALVMLGCAGPPVGPKSLSPLVPRVAATASAEAAPSRSEETPAEDPEGGLQERLACCDLDGIPVAKSAGKSAVVRVRNIPCALPQDGRQGWVIHAIRKPGAREWQTGTRFFSHPLAWEKMGRAHQLLLLHGQLTGRAIEVDAASCDGTLRIRALSYTDSGPPYTFAWSRLHADIGASRDPSDVVGDGWLLLRVRGRYNFEGQGPADGAICALVRTVLPPSSGDSTTAGSRGCGSPARTQRRTNAALRPEPAAWPGLATQGEQR
jgi:hypothetical protein